MIDDKATKERFGHLGTSLSPGSNKRIIYLCSICGEKKETKRNEYKEGQKCIKCAGSNRKIGQAAIKEDILRVSKLLSHQPTCQEYKENGKYSVEAVNRNFGKGWRGVLASIGLKVKRRPSDPYSLEDVIKELIAVKTKLGFAPSVKQYMEIGKINPQTVKRVTKCDTWVGVIEKVLGISREDGNFYSKGNYKTTKQYLEKLKELANKLGHAPSRTQADEEGFNSQELTKRLNTNWLGIIKAAKLDPKTLPNRSAVLFATKEDIIKDLHCVAKLIGRCPNMKDYDVHGNYGRKIVKRRLGNWQESIKAAGLDLTVRYKNKKDTIGKPTEYYLESLRGLALRLGRAPTVVEASTDGKALHARLKTDWAKILTIAGIDYLTLPSMSLMHYVSNEEILEDVRKVTNLIGHKPTFTEYKKHGIYPARTVKSRFGDSWSKALDKIQLDSIIPKTLPDEFISKPTKLSILKPSDISLHNSLDQDSVNNVKKFFDKQKFLSKAKE